MHACNILPERLQHGKGAIHARHHSLFVPHINDCLRAIFWYDSQPRPKHRGVERRVVNPEPIAHDAVRAKQVLLHAALDQRALLESKLLQTAVLNSIGQILQAGSA